MEVVTASRRMGDLPQFLCLPLSCAYYIIGAVATTRQQHHIEDGDGAKENAGDAHPADDGKDDSGENMPEAVSLSGRVLVLFILNPPGLGTHYSDCIPSRMRASHAAIPISYP